MPAMRVERRQRVAGKAARRRQAGVVAVGEAERGGAVEIVAGEHAQPVAARLGIRILEDGPAAAIGVDREAKGWWA